MRAHPDDTDVLARTRAGYASDLGELVVTPDRILFEHDDGNGFVHVDVDAVTAVAHAQDPTDRLDTYVGYGALAATAAIAAFAFANPVAFIPAAIGTLAALYVAWSAFLATPQRLRIDADGATYPFDHVSVDAAHDVRAAITDDRDVLGSDDAEQ